MIPAIHNVLVHVLLSKHPTLTVIFEVGGQFWGMTMEPGKEDSTTKLPYFGKFWLLNILYLPKPTKVKHAKYFQHTYGST